MFGMYCFTTHQTTTCININPSNKMIETKRIEFKKQTNKRRKTNLVRQ